MAVFIPLEDPKASATAGAVIAEGLFVKYNAAGDKVEVCDGADKHCAGVAAEAAAAAEAADTRVPLHWFDVAVQVPDQGTPTAVGGTTPAGHGPPGPIGGRLLKQPVCSWSSIGDVFQWKQPYKITT